MDDLPFQSRVGWRRVGFNEGQHKEFGEFTS